MPRDLVLGNGSLLVCLDRNLFIRDLYWPYVGLFNHLSGHAVRFGIGADDRFAWVDETWDKDLRYRPHSLVTDCHLAHDGLETSLSVADAVDYRSDLWVRQVIVRNPTDRPRDVRLYLAANFHICETDIGDTCYYDPYAGAVIHYKRDNYFLLGGQNAHGRGLSGYACGMKGLAGMDGTWHDCEDGVLSGNPIAQGSVDSAIEVAATLEPHGSATMNFWIAVGPTRDVVVQRQAALRRETPDALFDGVEKYWRAWVYRGLTPDRAHPDVGVAGDLSALPPRVAALFRRSLLLIRTQTDNRGGYPGGQRHGYHGHQPRPLLLHVAARRRAGRPCARHRRVRSDHAPLLRVLPGRAAT